LRVEARAMAACADACELRSTAAAAAGAMVEADSGTSGRRDGGSMMMMGAALPLPPPPPEPPAPGFLPSYRSGAPAALEACGPGAIVTLDKTCVVGGHLAGGGCSWRELLGGRVVVAAGAGHAPSSVS
jgi:hypothetical protein